MGIFPDFHFARQKPAEIRGNQAIRDIFSFRNFPRICGKRTGQNKRGYRGRKGYSVKRMWGPLGAAALLTLSLTACGDGNAYNKRANAYSGNGTLSENSRNVIENNGKLTDRDGVTDFGDTAERSVTERASDALENGVRRARDGLENAKESMDNDANRNTNS